MLDDLAFSIRGPPAPPGAPSGKRRPARPVPRQPASPAAPVPRCTTPRGSAAGSAAAAVAALGGSRCGTPRGSAPDFADFPAAGGEPEEGQEAALRRENAELSALCQKQREDIEALKARLNALEDDGGGHAARCEAQEEELETLQTALARKGMELRRAQEHSASLERDMRKHEQLAERFRNEVEDLEHRLRDLTQLKQRAEDEREIAEWHLKSAASARGTKRPGSRGTFSSRPATGCQAPPVGLAWGEAACGGKDEKPQPSMSMASTFASSSGLRATPRRPWELDEEPLDDRPRSQRGRIPRQDEEDEEEDDASGSSGSDHDDEDSVCSAEPAGPVQVWHR